MTKKLAAFALLLASGGCRMCSDSCDYGPVVPGGPPLGLSRAGSVSSGGGIIPYYDATAQAMPAPATTPTPEVTQTAFEATMPLREQPGR